MNNKKFYKDIMSNVQPSEQSVERIFDMTVDKKTNILSIFKRLASVALALAVVVCSGIGVNQYINSKNQVINTPSVTKTPVIQSNINPLSVMVAYAGEYKPVSELKAGSMNEQQVFYSIHYAEVDDEKACSEAERLYDLDKSNIEKNMDDLFDLGHSSTFSSGVSTVDSVKGEATVKVYVLSGGILALDTDDYSNVKNMTITNSSKYGELFFGYKAKSNSDSGQQIGNKVTISGNELRESQESKVYECGTSKTVNKGYELNWGISDEVYQAIGNDLKFDLSQIKDTITFTVEFNDGTVKTASLNLYFDSNGYMHFE